MKAKDYAVLHQHEALQILKHRIDFPFQLYSKILETPSITEIKYCTSNLGTNWLRPENAEGVEDNVCASCGFNGAILHLGTFGFAATRNPSYVAVDCKCICVDEFLGQTMDFYVWNGTSWIYFATIPSEWQLIPQLKCSDTYFRGWHDLSTIIDTAAKLNSIRFRAIHYIPGGGGSGAPEAWTSYVDAIKVKATH